MSKDSIKTIDQHHHHLPPSEDETLVGLESRHQEKVKKTLPHPEKEWLLKALVSSFPTVKKIKNKNNTK